MISTRLNKGWEHYRGSLGGVWEAWRKDKLSNHYNVPWHEVELPHCFNASDAVDPDVVYYQGQGWYRTLLEINNPYPQGRTLLHFEGVGQRSEVYVYTKKVGEHLGGYDEFVIDITEAAAEAAQIERYQGKVPTAVLADNTRDLEMIPSDISDFNLYGGIYRYVNLVYVPAISLERVHVDVSNVSEASASLKISGRLYNPEGHAEEANLHIVIKDPHGKEIARLETKANASRAVRSEQTQYGTRRIDFEVDYELQDPQLWSVDDPNLYTCTVTLSTKYGETAQTERFGVRWFEFVKNGPFKLNGKRLLLKGTHRHEDFAGVGAAMTEEMIVEEMTLIKEMGANFIRLGHYQQSRIVLDLCDELGLLVWEEIPWCRGGLGGERYKKQCKDMLTAMIDQHRNHPSVILWGLGNENDWEADFDYFDKEEIRAFMKELHDLSHSLDPSRLTAIRRCEFCKDIVDVYSPSIWAGWYRGIYLEYEKYTREAIANTDRFFHAEWGADNMAGRHVEKTYTGFDEIKTGQGADERDGDYFLHGGNPRVSSKGDWSETYFCEMIDWYLKCQETIPELTGTAQWAFKDFSTPVRPDAPLPYMNIKGIVERDLTKKEAYYVFQSYWSDKPMVRLYGHSWPIRWGEEGEAKQIRVYSNCEKAELFVNGKSCGVKVRDSQDFPCAGLRWDVVLQKGVNQLKVVASQGDVTVSDELQVTYQTEKWGEPHALELSTEKLPDGTVRLSVQAVDKNGIPCLDAAMFTRFGLTGDGRLIDNLGTVRGARFVQLRNGRAEITIDPNGGASVASVQVEGLPTVFQKIEA